MADLDAAREATNAVLRLVSAGCVVSSLQSLALKPHYRDDAVFAWRLHRTRSRRILQSRLLRVYDLLFGYPAILVVFVVRACACAALVVAANRHAVALGACAVAAATSILLAIRGSDGKNGADQMAKIVHVSMCMVLVIDDAPAYALGCTFLSFQLIIAYVTSGFLRIREPGWRDGSYLRIVLRQHAYGHRHAWQFATAHPRIARATSLLVLLFECTFLLAIIFPKPVLLAYLMAGVAFHVANATLIGLNTFVWAFAGCYPAVWWCWIYVHH